MTNLRDVKMGILATDAISHFTGNVIAKCEYMTGCNQILLQPRGADSSQRPDAEWFDIERLVFNDDFEPIQLPGLDADGGGGSGCDIEAPKR